MSRASHEQQLWDEVVLGVRSVIGKCTPAQLMTCCHAFGFEEHDSPLVYVVRLLVGVEDVVVRLTAVEAPWSEVSARLLLAAVIDQGVVDGWSWESTLKTPWGGRGLGEVWRLIVTEGAIRTATAFRAFLDGVPAEWTLAHLDSQR